MPTQVGPGSVRREDRDHVDRHRVAEVAIQDRSHELLFGLPLADDVEPADGHRSLRCERTRATTEQVHIPELVEAIVVEPPIQIDGVQPSKQR